MKVIELKYLYLLGNIHLVILSKILMKSERKESSPKVFKKNGVFFNVCFRTFLDEV